jgi:mono/diheme cytochrome c family protein
MSQLTLSRFFVIHVAALVPALAVLIGMHIASFRVSGPSGPWDEQKRKKSGPFWPDQVFRDTIVASAVVFILISLCVFFPPPFTGPADPSNTTYLPKPEWNFLFLYEALKYFQGPLEPVGALGVPGLLITLLLLLPFIDRRPERNPMLRPLAMVSLAVYAGFILVFTIMGYLSPGFAQVSVKVNRPGVSGKTSSGAVRPETGAAPGVSDGALLFKTAGCSACHGIQGKGGAVGPRLAGGALRGRDRAWLTDQIRNPKSHFPDTVMPAFTALSDREVNGLIDYLLGLQGTSGTSGETGGKTALPFTPVVSSDNVSGPAGSTLPGPAAYTIGSAANGAVLFAGHCSVCHGHAATGGVLNPGSDDRVVPPLNPIDRELFHADPRDFARNIDRFIQHGSMPEGPHPAVHMLPFGDSHALTQQEIANLEAYVLKLNGVDRAELIHPGMKPGHFFIVVAVAFGFVTLMLGGIWHRKFRRRD